MNEGQIKIKIFVIQVVDWSFLIAVFSVGVYAVLNPENRNLMVTVFLIGLFLLSMFGEISLNKIASLRMELDKLHKEEIK
jgi:hypothetical protein